MQEEMPWGLEIWAAQQGWLEKGLRLGFLSWFQANFHFFSAGPPDVAWELFSHPFLHFFLPGICS